MRRNAASGDASAAECRSYSFGGPYLRPGPVAFAHRGGAALWPENTLAAFAGAVELGFRFMETDLHRTRDGGIVCLHDRTLQRTTDGAGRVSDLDLDELRALDAGFRFTADGGRTFPFRGRGLRVPTLEEVYALHPALCLNVEIKQADPPMEDVLWEAIDRLGVADRILVAAEDDALTARFSRARPEATVPTSPGARGALRFWLGARTGLGRLDRYGFDALQVPRRHFGLRVVDRPFVEAAHRHGLKVHVWTIDDAETMHALLDMGVDGLMTDRPDRLAAVFAERGLRLDGVPQ